jgi:hypothetical protein
MGVKETRNHDENTIFLQLQVSVLLSYTHYYFGYSMLSVYYVCAQVSFYSASYWTW